MLVFDRLNQEMVKAVLETMPMEVTVIDANDEVVAWNKSKDRIFARPMTSMGLNFRECHPKKSLPIVEQIIDEMKTGKREVARYWIDYAVPYDQSKKHKILIEFYALRDETGKYIGCMECDQDIEDIQKLEGQRLLLDGKPEE